MPFLCVGVRGQLGSGRPRAPYPGVIFSLRELIRPLLVAAAVLVIPALPFLLLGEQLEAHIKGWFTDSPSRALLAWGTFAVLSVDAFLPVPSSFVSTLAGMHLAIPTATLVSWAGMTLGAAAGFAAARLVGRPIVLRTADPADVTRLDNLACRFGGWLLVVTRAVPLFAETTVFLMGAAGLPWSRFLLPVGLSNLGSALAYSCLGYYGQAYGAQYYALAASIALPLLAATMGKYLLRQRGVLNPPEAPRPPV